jgi:hypothetical protein
LKIHSLTPYLQLKVVRFSTKILQKKQNISILLTFPTFHVPMCRILFRSHFPFQLFLSRGGFDWGWVDSSSQTPDNLGLLLSLVFPFDISGMEVLPVSMLMPPQLSGSLEARRTLPINAPTCWPFYFI